MAGLHIDFETQSKVDLAKVGADNYARHPSTRVMAAAFASDDQAPTLIPMFEEPPKTLTKYVENGGIVKAWNAPFEWLIWNYVWRRDFPFLPELKIEQLRCVMVKSYAAGMPGKLEKAAPALGIDQAKDMKGNRVMMQLAQPKLDGTMYEPNQTPEIDEKFGQMYAYCVQDVNVERECDKRLLDLSNSEQELWFLDHKINQRGVAVDISSAKTAYEIVELEKKRLNDEMVKITDGQVCSTSAHSQLTNYVRKNGIKCTGVGKSDLQDLLEKEDLPQNVKRALAIRQTAAKSSTAKFDTIVSRTSRDSRMRSGVQFHGAGTGRWSGRGFQLHNLPRPHLKQESIETIFEVLK